MFPILCYEGLDYTGLKTKFDKVKSFISNADFKSADVKKLKPSGYLRAKLDDTNRLLFMPIKHNDKTCLLLLEVIKNHDYSKSRFLTGAEIKEEKISVEEINNPIECLKYTDYNRPVRLLDKFIVFGDEQDNIFQYNLPLVIIGSAGSGKTSVVLEKLKTFTGNCLYISLSSFLVNHTQKSYYSYKYNNDDQELEFLSFEEFLETIKVLESKEITSNVFINWFQRQKISKKITDGRKLFEEFRGVITGSDQTVQYLSKEQYLSLGIKQSIYLQDEKTEVYSLFEKYLIFLKEGEYHDSNIISNKYQEIVSKKYDFIVVDEVQDFTNSQLSLVLQSIKTSSNFILCGDSNQVVHPNFFSWSNLKSYFYEDQLETNKVTQILSKNYRNSPEVTELANRILKFKNYRFGSIDKESHYLIESVANTAGGVSCVEANLKNIKEFNEKTSKSINYAILVLHENDKHKAAKHFDSPLIFTVQEAKGLEYQNIILYNFISDDSKYTEISKGADKSYLSSTFEYARAKNKTDKSLEAYKFYINSLYVAVTRSVKNVYLIEDNPKHKFLNLLEINEINSVLLDSEASSSDDWQKEASKLAMQGKEEQAKAIEDNILKKKQIPWKVLESTKLNELTNKCLLEHNANKKEQILLLNYAVVYNNMSLIADLRNSGLKAAQNISKCSTLLEDDYFRNYAYRNDQNMLGNIKNYGIEFRNEFNMTPLMCAAYMGSEHHTQKLLELGANVNEIDNNDRTPLFISLSRAVRDNKFSSTKLPNIYSLLAPDTISVQVDHQLVKIPFHKGEFLLLLWMIMLHKNESQNTTKGKLVAFSAGFLSQMFSKFDNRMIPIFRKRREYISGLLSKNEVQSNSLYNYKLFIRAKRGIYIINHDLKVKVKDKWINILE